MVARWHRRTAVVALLTLCLLSSGCASIISGSTELVTFTSNPDNAQIEIISHSGQVIHRSETPTSLELKRGRGYFQGADLSIKVSKTGYTPKTVPVGTRLNGWYIGNLLFGGLIGMLIVDPITGAMYSFPDQVHTDLTPESTDLGMLPNQRDDTKAMAIQVTLAPENHSSDIP